MPSKADLLVILKEATNPTLVEFSEKETQNSARRALASFLGVDLDNLTVRDINRYSVDVFDIISTVVDDVVADRLQTRMGEFAEIKKIGRNEQARFVIRTNAASEIRLGQGIRQGARGGIYKARRLDGREFILDTTVETVAYLVTLEEILTGTRTIKELVDILTAAWEEKIYIEVFNNLSAAAEQAPSFNKVTGSTTAINNESLDKLIAIVSAYGRPAIFGFRQHLALLGNTFIKDDVKAINDADLMDIRNKGYVGTYKGTPVIELPNYIAVHNDDKLEWVFNENKLFILPANEKPVKVVFQGESYTAEVNQPHGGKEFHQHRMIGVGVVFNKNIASYELKDNWT